MGKICDVCGATATGEQVFTRESITFSRAKVFCPNCHARFSNRFLQWFVALIILGGIVGAIWAVFQPRSIIASLLLTLGVLQFFLIAVIIPHEFAHAFTARWLGFHVQSVSVGFGKRLFQCELFGFWTEFKRMPLGGLTLVWPDTKPHLRLRWFFMVLAGPAINALLALVALQFLEPSERPDFNLPQWNEPLRMFIAANILVTIENLFPFRYNLGQLVIPSDGLAMFQCLFPNATNLGSESKAARGWHLLAKIFLICLFGIGALLCFSLLFFLVFVGRNKMSMVVLAFLFGLFGFMGAAMSYAVYRACRWKLQAKSPNNVVQLFTETGNQ